MHGVHIVSDAEGRHLGWTAEFALPREFLRGGAGSSALPPRPMDRWRINLCRCDRPKEQPEDLSAWCDTESDTFHVPEKFGILEFRDET